MTPKIIEYSSRVALAAGLADLLARRLADLVGTRGTARIAVPGGTTPAAMLTLLGQADLDWSHVTVTLTDERWVPSSSPRSNQRLLAETLFAGGAAAATFVPLYSGAAEPTGALAAVAEGVEQTALPLDIAVLGMGVDMHTASLFPGAVGLAAALAPDAPAVVAIKAAGAEEPRVTLTARVLKAAGERHIMIAGADKRAALARALAMEETSDAPIRAVLSGATVHYSL
ncbi:6-phosphogluconolactonase [Breoghania sp. L-A4]|uniref:6-phosphogluconolactonase n=1 Tax=Breoghania sp. L-A4 TaxID=2304600 RepID=UPI000E358E62|nr:6-phosphogluconolactonase [Breoghania sp. L-A4]AXS42210.1 6-phosphogluconolactonase [Breoghania sp. L-A4]